MKNKLRSVSLALVFCISVFFTPVTVHARGDADTTPPVVRASLSGNMLHIEVSDDNSGVDAVFVGGQRVQDRIGNEMDLVFRDYARTTDQMIDVYAVDFAGNKSDPVAIKNPYYKSPVTTSQAGDPSSDTKTSASASADPEEEPDTKPLTPDGQATVTDSATDKDGKEFYTFTTPNGNVFYLVIDKQRESPNVYFLNAVTEDDLIDLAEKDTEKNTGGESAIPEVLVCACKDKCEAGAVDTACPICKNDWKGCTGKTVEKPANEEPEPPQKDSGGGSMIFILFVVAAIGGAGYYFKVYKPKHDLDDAEDLDDLLGNDDEPEINEDAEDTTPIQTNYDEESKTAVVYDDYPDDDYSDEDPEDIEDESETR